jgi:thiosulfate dehydrogenase [quinone] large subunit
MSKYTIEVSRFSHFFTADKRSAVLWLIVRVYLGWTWLEAGWAKLYSPAWAAGDSGSGIVGFVKGALAKTAGAHPDVQSWYATFLRDYVLAHPTLWSYLITWGEILVGAALIAGFLVGLAALGGVFMNLNFLLAGTVSINPIMLTLGIGLILAWRVAGYWGADRYVLPLLHRPIRLRTRSG